MYVDVVCESLQMTIKLDAQPWESLQKDSREDSQPKEKLMTISIV